MPVSVSEPAKSNNALLTLQAGRGLAALAVLLHHACNGVVRQGGELPAWLTSVCAYGYLGVDFFFVLSGFIIYYVNAPRRDRPGFAATYIEARLVRVYIPYLPLGIAIGLAYLALPQLASGDNNWNWFSTLTLLPSSGFPALAPAWTLQHEILFYFIALFAFLTRSFVAVSVIAATAAVAVWLFAPMSYKGFGLIDLEFIFGIVAAWCFLNGRLRANGLLVAAGLLLCAGFFLTSDRFLSVIFGLGLALVLLPMVRAESAGIIKVGPLLLLLGNASYAIYLVHYPIVSALARVGAGVSGPVAFAGIVIVSTIAGIAFHKFYEVHALRLARRAVAALRPVSKAELTVASQPLAENDFAAPDNDVGRAMKDGSW